MERFVGFEPTTSLLILQQLNPYTKLFTYNSNSRLNNLIDANKFGSHFGLFRPIKPGTNFEISRKLCTEFETRSWHTYRGGIACKPRWFCMHP